MPRNERAPLDFTKPRSTTHIVVCPHCLGSSTVSLDFVAKICICGQYFNVDQSLPEDQATHVNDVAKPINKAYTKLKGHMEKKAYEYKDKVMDKRKTGKVKDHEQINVNGTMPKKKWGRDNEY